MRISLILPYWDRQEAADRALALLARTYVDIDMEVIVVDDGNPIPFAVPDIDLNIRVVTLPVKHDPKSPVSAWNAGVSAASGKIIVLSCIEILHEAPVLEQMAEAVEDIGELGYVLASAWCPETQSWHCHSSVKVPRNPAGTGIAFCGAMHKSLFDKAGGFGEEYREGAGYEDNDFINRVLVAGGRFKIRDDLVVVHPKTGASIEWGAAKFARNEALYYDKWPREMARPITNFICLNAGNYCGRGAEYVNKLFDMVRRNLSENIDARFICLTDDPTGLHEDIEAMSLPPGIDGWWGKLYMFKRGLLADGERMIYLDLDTLVVGNLRDIVAYDGELAMLRDFLAPSMVAPGAMLWKAGSASNIWEEWEAQGRPKNPMGDLWWINGLRAEIPKIDHLQEVLPDQFVSYKLHAIDAPPAGSSIVCFHGLPRPHAVGGWVADVWKNGGLALADLGVKNNVSDSVIRSNIVKSSMRKMPWLELADAKSQDVVIIGGAPSMSGYLEEIRLRQQLGSFIVCLNGAGAYLNARGIVPDAIVVVDARAGNARFVQADAGHYFLASQCDESLFDATDGRATLFHIDIPNIGRIVPGDRPIQAVGGGVTVGLIAISLMYALGFRSFQLYGYDSSYSGDAHHAYAQVENDGEPLLEPSACGQSFICAPWMVTQVTQFQDLLRQLVEMDCRMSVHGTGLLPTVFDAIYQELPEVEKQKAA